jgi:hypothetical protein
VESTYQGDCTPLLLRSNFLCCRSNFETVRFKRGMLMPLLWIGYQKQPLRSSSDKVDGVALLRDAQSTAVRNLKQGRQSRRADRVVPQELGLFAVDVAMLSVDNQKVPLSTSCNTTHQVVTLHRKQGTLMNWMRKICPNDSLISQSVLASQPRPLKSDWLVVSLGAKEAETINNPGNRSATPVHLALRPPRFG